MQAGSCRWAELGMLCPGIVLGGCGWDAGGREGSVCSGQGREPSRCGLEVRLSGRRPCHPSRMRRIVVPCLKRRRSSSGPGAEASELRVWLWGWGVRGRRTGQETRHHLWLIAFGSQAPMTLA